MEVHFSKYGLQGQALMVKKCKDPNLGKRTCADSVLILWSVEDNWTTHYYSESYSVLSLVSLEHYIWYYQSSLIQNFIHLKQKHLYDRWPSTPDPRHWSDWSGPVSVFLSPSPGSGPRVAELNTPVMPAQPSGQSPEPGTSWSPWPASGPSHVEQHLDTWHVGPGNVLLWQTSALLILAPSLTNKLDIYDFNF